MFSANPVAAVKELAPLNGVEFGNVWVIPQLHNDGGSSAVECTLFLDITPENGEPFHVYSDTFGVPEHGEVSIRKIPLPPDPLPLGAKLLVKARAECEGRVNPEWLEKTKIVTPLN